MTSRNIDHCISWLQDSLKLTKEEEEILLCLSKGQKYIPIELLKPFEQDFILLNCKTQTAEEIAFELGIQPRLVINFLKTKGIKNCNMGFKRKLTEENKEYILQNYLTKTVCEMAEHLDILDKKNLIRTFLSKRGLKAVSAKRSKT